MGLLFGSQVYTGISCIKGSQQQASLLQIVGLLYGTSGFGPSKFWVKLSGPLVVRVNIRSPSNFWADKSICGGHFSEVNLERVLMHGYLWAYDAGRRKKIVWKIFFFLILVKCSTCDALQKGFAPVKILPGKGPNCLEVLNYGNDMMALF